MASTRKTAVVVCPGRGTYGKGELGYLARHHSHQKELMQMVDGYRREQDQPTISDLDQAPNYSLNLQGRGDHASPLIFTCAYADFLAIDQDEIEVVAVTGNSMGWYIALACAGATSPKAALHIVNTMGRLMQDEAPGGQLIYPVTDDNWQAVPGRREQLTELVAFLNGKSDHELYLSIDLGGFLVFAGNNAAIGAMQKILPTEQDRFPMVLANHAAFHCPLQAPIAQKARHTLEPELIHSPKVPLIDGRGRIWFPHATSPASLWRYTLDAQVVAPYDFTRAVQVAVREFVPDHVIVLGPGSSLGAPVAQSLIDISWRGMTSKETFQKRQKKAPFLISMGFHDQRSAVVQN
ncbi:MAG: ACP S-malonyltransferase [Pseudomonadota bacterium]